MDESDDRRTSRENGCGEHCREPEDLLFGVHAAVLRLCGQRAGEAPGKLP